MTLTAGERLLGWQITALCHQCNDECDHGEGR